MKVKLTLSVDDKAIEAGKRYAAQQNKSLSKMVESYLLLLDEPDIESIPISRQLQSLVGIGAGRLDEAAYKEHLAEEYL